MLNNNLRIAKLFIYLALRFKRQGIISNNHVGAQGRLVTVDTRPVRTDRRGGHRLHRQCQRRTHHQEHFFKRQPENMVKGDSNR